MRNLLFLSVLALAACGVADGTPATSTAPVGTPEHPVVIELFQSQGCSSCPPPRRSERRNLG